MKIFDILVEHEAHIIFKMKLVKISLLAVIIENKSPEDDFEFSIDQMRTVLTNVRQLEDMYEGRFEEQENDMMEKIIRVASYDVKRTESLKSQHNHIIEKK